MSTDLAVVQPLADLLPEPMLIVQPDGAIRAANRAFSASFGWSREEAVGHGLARFVTTPLEDLTEFLRHSASTSGFLPGALSIRHRNGADVPCRAEGAALRHAGSPADRLIVVRLLQRESAVARFVELTQQLGDLGVEVVRRRRAERTAADALDCERRLRDRLIALAEASGALVASLALTDVLPAVGKLAVGLIPADAHAVWYSTPGQSSWRTVWQEGLSDTFVREVDDWKESGRAGATLSVPLFVEDVRQVPVLAARQAVYAAEGIESLIVIPLRAEGTTHGTVVAYSRRRMAISEDDRCVATALGNLASAALATARLYEAESASRFAAQMAAERAAFLARASNVLASSLDYESTLKTVAELAVPEIADWCAVDIATEHGELRRLAVAHADPEKAPLARQMQERYPPDPHSRYGAAEVLRTGKPTMMSRTPPEVIAASVRDAEHLTLIRSLGLTSFMCVPLITRGRAIGALTFVSAESGREYTEADLRLAEDVAARAAMAVENARAYEEIQRANRVKDEFLATLSHELRTPLNAVLGYARMIRSGVLGPGKRDRALEVLERNAVSLNQMVEDILDVSRIVAGKIRLEVQPVDLSLVLHDAAETVRPAAEARGITLMTEIDPVVSPVSGDADRLQQVVWNLLSNAVKFTGRDGQVQMRLEQAGSHVQIVVTDTGAGIRPDFLPYLFEPFRQADSSFSREHGGLGLGLAIARHIVEMHGGTIQAESNGEGHGATFTVRLPVVAVDRQPLPEFRRVLAGAEEPALPLLTDRLQGVRVLVVDDDADARMLVADILQAAGAHITAVDSARAALGHLEEGDVPDVMLTDVGMPGMDGLEMMARIRTSARADVRNLPSIALTAYARSEDRLRVLDTGCQMHVAKPVRPEELIAAIRSVATRSREA